MKHWAAFAGTALLLTGALVWSEMRKVDAPIGPEPILNLVADTQRELTRLPVAFAPLPDAEEIKIGRELEKSYLNMSRPEQEVRDREIEHYVEQVGARVAAHARRKLPYRFHYIPNLDFVNAFALPGGPVFVGGGLLALVDSEDELAAILGHEIEHIEHYHCAERVQVQAAMRRVPLGGLMVLPVEIFVAGYSKNQELEADREGTTLAAAASYSPEGAVQIFQAFERAYPTRNARAGSPQEELSEVARKTLEGYLRSHPSNAERIDQIRKLIAGGQLPAWNRTKPLPLAYLFLTERAWRSLQTAQTRPYAYLTQKEEDKLEAERVKQIQQAIQLARRSLELQPAQPRAMEIVAVANLALGDYAAATAIYHKLLPNSPTTADGVRVYADTLARQAIETRQYATAVQLARESLAMQPNQAEALQILAEAEMWLSDFTGVAEIVHKLKNMYPQAAEEVCTYAANLAATNFNNREYQKAVSLATLSLEYQPGWREPLTILAKAQFALANFSAAAGAYWKILDLEPDIDLVRSYADALAANETTRQTARDFETRLSRFTRAATPAMATQMRVELAGLSLMAGDETVAKTLIAQAQGPESSIMAPEFLGRLGWWYYRAGNHTMSAALLGKAVAQRPGNLSLQASLAWNELAQHQLDNAIRRFSAADADGGWNSPVMGRAIARWQQHQTKDALKDFEAATKAYPEWLNPRWVKALYPAAVAQSVAEMRRASGLTGR